MRYPVIPNAAMLMIVPLMIWSARTEIDNQACTSETRTPASSASRSATTSVVDAPKTGHGSVPSTGARYTPATKPTNADTSIVPSMPMLTTPDRSHMTPHNAAKAYGVAECMMIGEMSGRTATR